MRKVLVCVLVCLILSLSACGNGSEKTDGLSSEQSNETISKSDSIQEAKPVNLTGNWEQSDKKPSDTYQVGYISGDRIEIFWVMDEGETFALYWSGTYKAPTETAVEYSWDSNNDKMRTDSALLASGDDKKTFTYKNGELSYEASAMGVTNTIVLIPSETDYMKLKKVDESADTSNLQQVELTNSEYYISEKDGKVKIYYIVGISNPNEEYAIEFPKINITARDENEKILKTETMTLSGIAAGDGYPYAGYVYYEGVAPTAIDINVENDNYYLAQSSSGIIYVTDLPVTNVSANLGNFGVDFTGEVTNNSTEELSNVSLMVYYYSGEEAETDGTYIDNLGPGETKPFEISTNTDFESIDGYLIWAIQW